VVPRGFAIDHFSKREVILKIFASNAKETMCYFSSICRRESAKRKEERNN
jgi:hypothetical protein